MLNDREKAAVLWAEHVTLNTARERDDVYRTVKAQFSDQEMVELTLMSGFFNMFNRFTDSLKIPLEAQDEVDLIKWSVRLDPAKVKSYLESVLAAWPDEFPEPNPDGGLIDHRAETAGRAEG